MLPDLDEVTLVIKPAHNSSHGHFWIFELTRNASKDEVLAAFRTVPRIAFIRVSDGIAALNSTLELMSDLGHPRGDMWEVAIWEDVLMVEGNEVYYTYQVYNQTIVTPENVDAIRALSGIERSGARSIEKTARALGVLKEFLVTPAK